MDVTKTKCPIAMKKISKSQIYRNFGPLLKHGPHWINFIILIFISEKKRYFKNLHKILKKKFHLT